MKPVIFHTDAQAELDREVAFYERKKAGLGLDLQSEVQRTVQRIQINPGIGAAYKTTRLRHQRVHRFPHVVFYMELEDVIWIAAVAHGSRRPGYWKSRRPKGSE